MASSDRSEKKFSTTAYINLTPTNEDSNIGIIKKIKTCGFVDIEGKLIENGYFKIEQEGALIGILDMKNQKTAMNYFMNFIGDNLTQHLPYMDRQSQFCKDVKITLNPCNGVIFLIGFETKDLSWKRQIAINKWIHSNSTPLQNEGYFNTIEVSDKEQFLSILKVIRLNYNPYVMVFHANTDSIYHDNSELNQFVGQMENETY